MADININTVNKYYGDVHVIKDVSLDIKSQSFTVLVGPSGCGKSTMLRMIAGLEDINSGTIHGIIGENGSGKSTLINLICGLLKPSKGTVLVDDKDIQTCISEWQNQIGYVSQNTYLLDDNVESNIALGFNEENIDTKKVGYLMKFLEIDNKLNSKTNVGEAGKNISGGQKQKIAIIRALYNDPEILILDEATNEMDFESERKFLDKICSKNFTKTVIMISHNLKSLKRCEFVYSLQNGQLSKTEINGL